jgi:protease-4
MSLFFKPKPRTKEISQKRWNWPSIIGRAIKKTCTVIGAIILISVIGGIILSSSMRGEKAGPLPGKMVLHLKLDAGIGEQGREPTFTDPFPFARPTIRQIVDTFDYAATDDRVKALVVELETGGLDIAHIQEMRTAVKRFRASGKQAYIFSTSYGDFGQGLGGYYLASAFDKIWMQPVGMLSIAGIGMEVPYVKGLMDEYGVHADFYHLEEYKNAMESFTNTEMSKPSEEMMISLVEGLAGQMLGDIAADRKIDPLVLKGYIDSGLLTGSEALKHGLIDRLDYADTMREEIQVALGGDTAKDEPPYVEFDEYAPSKPHVRGPQIVLVYASGMIAPGGSGEGVADAESIASAITEAAEDDKYKVIVIRVDSPGGSPSASETIRRAIVKAKEKNKKVIISMGPVAASGGYWLATDADRIFALPSTLTGSIGVIMGKFELSGLWEKFGVNWQSVKWGQNAGLWSMNKSFTASEQSRILLLLNDIYTSFIDRVAKGRHMSEEDVRKIAKGRAWTGEDALKNGLVDELGGLDAALDYAAKEAGATDRSKLTIDVLPKPEGTFQQLMRLFGAEAKVSDALKIFSGMQNKMQVIGSGPVAYDPVLDMAR